MLKLTIFFFRILFRLISQNSKDLIIKNAILEKEVSILKRRLKINNYKVKFSFSDKITFAITNKLSLTNNLFTIVNTATVLKWYRRYIKRKWIFKKGKKVGRPAVNKRIVNLIIKMKNSNIMWGCRRISDELKKIDINVSHETIRKIISNKRKEGKIKKSLTWKAFIKSHINSLYSMDFFTIDSVLSKRYYIFVLIEVKTRKLIQFAINEYPNREFVRQQIIEFTNTVPGLKVLIHDRAQEFCTIDYSQYDVKAQKISVKSPNMNSYIERVIGTIQREALDWYIIINKKQLFNILKEYVHYYNNYRPHQGIGKIPIEATNMNTGIIIKKPILQGLHNHYFRAA